MFCYLGCCNRHLTSCSHRPADAQRERERDTVYGGEKGQCRALVSVRDSTVQEVCANFENTFGMGPKAMKDRTIATIFGPEPDMQSWRMLLDTAKLGTIKEHKFNTYSMNGNPMKTLFHAQPWCSDRGEVSHVMLSLTTLVRECPLSCPCQSDFRQPKNIHSMLEIALESRQAPQIRRAALNALLAVSSDTNGIETLRQQHVLPELAKIAARFGSGSSKDLGLIAMNILKEVASEKASAMINDDIIQILLSMAFDSENDGSRRQLLALESLQSLAWEQQCVDMMLDSDFDVVTMLAVVQQRMTQEGHSRHSWAAAQALNSIRNSNIGGSDAMMYQQRLMTVLQEEHTWGVDESMRAQALRETLMMGGSISRRNSRANSRNTSAANSRASSKERSPSIAGDLSATNQSLLSILPAFVQESLAPIAMRSSRAGSLKSDTSSKEVFNAERGRAPGRERSASLTSMGWGDEKRKAKDGTPRRESAAETRERRAARRELERLSRIETPRGPDSATD